MRRIAIALMSTLSGLVLLFSYHTSLNQGVSVASSGGTTPTPSTTPGTTSGTSGTPGTSGTSAGTTTKQSTATPQATSSAGSTTKAATGTSGQFTGTSVDTRWGPVQVRITVKNGKITASEAVVYPNGNGRDIEINNYALPILAQETVKAQNAQIDAISGATVTSDGYISSLQSALDQAHLG